MCTNGEPVFRPTFRLSHVGPALYSITGWVGEVTKKIGKEQKEDSGEKTRHSHTHAHSYSSTMTTW